MTELRLTQDVNICINTPNQENQEKAPFEDWAFAAYVAGNNKDVEKFIALYAKYVVHRATHPLIGTDRKQWPPVSNLRMRIYPHIGMNLGNLKRITNATNLHIEVEKESMTLPLPVFGVKPPTGNRILIAHVEIVSDTHVMCEWSGRTYQYQDRFQAQGIPLKDRIRVMNGEQEDMSMEKNIEFVCKIFTNVLRNAVCNVRVKGKAADKTPAAKLLEKLRSMPSLCFDAF